MKRSSGILMHITSLPSPYGIGSMGKSAFDFIDFLKKAGQTYWQILPINPPGYGDSPYQAFSTFAGNPYLIDLDQLVQNGWLKQEELDRVSWGSREDQVDFSTMYDQRLHVLHLAWSRFHKAPADGYAEYLEQQKSWLDEYVLFMAVKAYYNDGPWTQWPLDIRMHQPEAMARYREQLRDEIDFQSFLQFCFHTQWQRLRAYAHENGIQIIGDIPIYVSPDSSDLWTHPELFQTDGEMHLTQVAGCPPDAFAADGQLWGNPLYDWAYHKKTGYAWWIQRVRHALGIYDLLRIDHFRGFDTYWAIPATSTTARTGKWENGPGMELFDALEAALGKLPIIAEDLGELFPSVRKLLADSTFPGMKVLQFAFDSREDSDYLPHNYPRHCVVYTGTHDNDTIMGWMHTASPEDVRFAWEYLRLTEAEGPNWGMMCGALQSPGDTVILTMQDLLGLGSEGRMNIPSTLGGNWKWRAAPDSITPELADRLHHVTGLYRRLPR